MTKTLTLVIAATATLLATPVLADVPTIETSNRVAVSRTVEYGDLNLSSAADRDMLDRRIATAVRRTCGEAQSRDLGQLGDISRCRREARAFAANGRELAIAAQARRDVALLARRTADLSK